MQIYCLIKKLNTMNSNFYKLIVLLMLCFSNYSFGQDCINTFDNASSIDDYTVTGAVNTFDSDYYIPCGTEIPSFSEITTANSVSIVTSSSENVLPSIPGFALKINPTNYNNSDRTTIRTTPFTINNDNSILSFQFLQVGHTSVYHLNPYFQYRLLNANTFEELDAECYEVYHENTDSYDECLYDSDPLDPDTSIVYTPNWVTKEIDVSQISSTTNLILEFTVSDCGTMANTGANNHYSTVYIDNICQSSVSEGSEGSITMTNFEAPLNCPENIFTVSGTYTTANCNDEPVSITAYLSPYYQNNQSNTSGAVEIATASFNDSQFNFSINPNNFINIIPSQDYNIFVIITFSDGSTLIDHGKFEELSFDGCIINPDPCQDTSITITNEDQLPNCIELGSFWNHDINVSINLPTGYGLDELQSDLSNGNLYLNIIDESDESSPFFTETWFTNVNPNEIENDGIFNYTYRLESHGNMINMTDTTYRFEIIANLNGECHLSEEFSLDICEDTLNPCEYLSMSFDYIDNTPDCNIFENGDTYQICGTFSALDGIGYNMFFSVENINNTSDNFYIPVTLDPNSISIIGGVVTGSYCVDLLESNFNTNDDSYYISKHIRYNDTSILCNAADVSYPIPLNDCQTTDPCNIASVNITSEIPSCEELLENGSFEVCGEFVIPAGNDIQTVQLYLDQADLPAIILYDNNPTITNTDNDGNSYGDYCVTINQSNFPLPLEGNYTISTLIGLNNCKAESDILNLSFDNCQTECEPIRDIKIEDGRHLVWYGGNAENYTLLFVKDESCGEYREEPNEEPIEINLNDNYFNLSEILEQLGKCVKFKVKSDCDDTRWCSLVFNGEYWTLPNGNCLDTGRERVISNTINIYPNPAKNSLSISVNNSKLTTIELYDIYGTRVQTINNLNTFTHKLNVNKLTRGFYVVKVILQDGSSQHKNLILK